MGLAIEREHFAEGDYARFSARLDESLIALRELLARPGFGTGPASIGAELELFLIDAGGSPLPRNHAVLAETVDPRVTVELDRFNLECNLRPSLLRGRPFASLRREFEDALAEVRRAAALHGGRVAAIGILPTLRAGDLQSDAMTDVPRFRALSAALQRLRKRAPFRMVIDGEDPLEVTCDDVTFEGANTSLQLHLRVEPASFAATFDAAQLASAPALAVSGNSPTLIGHRLWEETRVALFKQAVDDRAPDEARRVGRVSFGTHWASSGAFELFSEGVTLHEPLLPVLSGEDPLACVRAGGVPRLEEMRLHQGTVWRWNRAIYDPEDGGHLRIEMRGLPAGPTPVDMCANAAFLVGLALGLAPDIESYRERLPFGRAHVNFYRAAQHGLGARLTWPSAGSASFESASARDLVLRLLPLARAGLDGAGVAPDESECLLGVIERRATAGRTGAAWQRAALAALEPARGRESALRAMLDRYLEHSTAGSPVHTWPVP